MAIKCIGLILSCSCSSLMLENVQMEGIASTIYRITTIFNSKGIIRVHTIGVDYIIVKYKNIKSI